VDSSTKRFPAARAVAQLPNPDMTPELKDQILNRLLKTSSDKPWALVVLAALEGQATLDDYLDNVRHLTMPTVPVDEGVKGPLIEPPGVYVSSITVEGFRGVGKSASIPIPPGPGLTLVVGRNGSGKSSFAEGFELLLTGRNFRWEKPRSKVWQEGWRNLHHTGAVSLKAGLLVEGEGPLNVSRAWASTDLAKSEASVTRRGQPARSLDSIGWTEALTTFRPFLSYNELGSLLEDGPSKIYDALSAVLGLEEIVDLQNLLLAAYKTRQGLVAEAKEGAAAIDVANKNLTAGSNDVRFAALGNALKWPSWNIKALAEFSTGESSNQDVGLLVLNKIRSIGRLDTVAISDVVVTLRATQLACEAFDGTNAEKSKELAQLLENALRFHNKHKNNDCQVCGSANVLSESWHVKTSSAISQLRAEAAAFDLAESNRNFAIRSAQGFVSAPPTFLAQANGLGLMSLDEVSRQWESWTKARDFQTAPALVDHFEANALALSEAIDALVDEATEEVKRREDLWRPIALKVADWLPKAKVALAASGRIDEIKAAETWCKDAASAIRDERFVPIADRAVAIWKQLRMQSNVDLGRIELEGAAQRRRVALRVTVDGTPAEALGVMSQGELHALALSLFLPRATLPESPFRFVLIDDPVQSMDPARVEGLARALAETAIRRQVVVFTHDDRLPEAVRRLGIPAKAFAVTRRANSIVEVRTLSEPVSGYLDDARALAKTIELPPGVASRVVPGFCRAAVEAACMETVRRRRLVRGELHGHVEELLAANARPHPLMALALFDDERQTNEVLPRLNSLGRWAADAFQAIKAGAHVAHEGDLGELIRSSEKLAKFVSKEVQ
jgi:hypothetical protein